MKQFHLVFLGLASMVFPTVAGKDLAEKKMLFSIPQMELGEPAPGKRVKIIPPEYEGTDVYYTLYLPPDYQKGEKYPVIVEYTGNHFPASGSTGEVKDANLGYAIARKLGMIWVVMPYVSADRQTSLTRWWGDPKTTLDYCRENLRRICLHHGGDSAAIFLCGFSRGAIGVNYLGLHDDESADIWLGFFSHDHYDGLREWKNTTWGSPLPVYRQAAAARFTRIAQRAILISHNGGTGECREYIEKNNLEKHAEIHYVAPKISSIIPNIPSAEIPHPHTDKWLCFQSLEAERVFSWFKRIRREKPGTGSISGRILDSHGNPLSGVLLESGYTHVTSSDPDGNYRLEGLTKGKRNITITTSGKKKITTEIILQSNIRNLNFRLP